TYGLGARGHLRPADHRPGKQCGLFLRLRFQNVAHDAAQAGPYWFHDSGFYIGNTHHGAHNKTFNTEEWRKQRKEEKNKKNGQLRKRGEEGKARECQSKAATKTAKSEEEKRRRDLIFSVPSHSFVSSFPLC